MSRIRYIADNPRGKHGGHNDVRTLFAEPTSAMRNVVNRADRVHGGRVLIVDLDEQPEYGVDADAEFQFAERQMLRWTQICQELRPGLPLGDARDPEPIRLTASDIRKLALVANEWLQAAGKSYDRRRRADVDLRGVLEDLFRDGKLPVGVLESLFYGPLDEAAR